MMTSTGYTSAVMDVVKAFGWQNFTDEQLETLLFALMQYVQMRKL
jgi:hypothetical protein